MILPGDLNIKKKREQVIRVNHAGEYGAKCIYSGQLAVLKSKEDQELLNHMKDQEQVHLDYTQVRQKFSSCSSLEDILQLFVKHK